MDFEKFMNDIELNGWKVHGVEVYSGGKLCHSFGDTHNTVYPIYSATKSILSAAVGVAADRGLIDFNKCILSYIPDAFTDEMTDRQRDLFSRISLHRLMTMSVPGFPFRPEGESFLRFSLNCSEIRPDEVSFDYSNIPAYLTGVALSSAIGGDAWTFIDGNILKPLGITDAEYTRCPDGFFYGASGMKLTVNDLSRIGLMFYNGGTYDGRRIISEEYVRKATSVLQMNREGGYGYFMWKYRDGFSINGKWKQKCYILPKRGLMITFLSDIRDDSDGLRYSMERNILGEDD